MITHAHVNEAIGHQSQSVGVGRNAPSSPGSSSRLGVAYLCPGWPMGSSANGIIVCVAEMYKAWRRRREPAFVLTSHLVGENTEEGVIDLRQWPDARNLLERVLYATIGRYAPRRVTQLRMRNRVLPVLGMLHREHGVQIFEMEESFGLAARIAPHSCVPVVVRLHGTWLPNDPMSICVDAKQAKNLRKKELSIRAASAISAPSSDILNRTRNAYELELPDAVVIPNPVCEPPPEAMWSYERCDKNRLVFIGRFDRHKGADILLSAFAKVLDRYPDCRLTMIGPDRGLVDDAGKQWSQPDFVADRFPDRKRRSQIECLGAKPHEALAELRSQGLMTIISSRYESFGVVATEAMILGCPLVATRTGGLAEIVQHEQTGLLARPGDADDLANQIMRLLADHTLAQRLGNEATKHCHRHYTPDAIARESHDFYESVVQRCCYSK